MDFKNKLIFSIDFIQSNKKRFLGEVILLILSFCLFIIGFLILEERKKYRYQVEQACRGDLSNIGYIHVSQNVKGFQEIDKLLRKEKKISAYTSSMGSGFLGDKELSNYIEGREIDYDCMKEMCMNDQYDGKVLTIDIGGLEIFSMDLIDGKIWSKKEFDDKKNDEESKTGEKCTWTGVYLGAKYIDIPVGTIIKAGDSGRTYEILGHLKEDSKLLKELDLYYEANEIRDKVYYNLNNCAVVISLGDCIDGKYLFKVKDGEDLNAVCSYLNDKYYSEYSIYSEKLEDILNKSEKAKKPEYYKYFKLFFLIGIVTVCAIACMEIVSIINKKETLGIFIANGASVSDLKMMIVIEAGLKLLLCFVVVFLLGMYILNGYLQSFSVLNPDYILLLNNLYMRNVFPKALIGMVLIYGIANIIPMYIMLNNKPADLLRGIK